MGTVSIVIPVYNEVHTIKRLIQRVKDSNIEKEIIIVDDCSTDGSRELLQDIKEDGIKVFFHEENKGKGAALRTSFKHITGEVAIIQDADLEYDPQDYIKLIKPIYEEGAEVVYGSRFLNRKHMPHCKHFFYLTHFIGNKFLNFLLNLLYGTKITDMETCYKAIKRKALEKLNLCARGFDIEPEITAQLIRKGFKIQEVPISYHPRDYREGKKISWKDGLVAACVLFKYRFNKIGKK